MPKGTASGPKGDNNRRRDKRAVITIRKGLRGFLEEHGANPATVKRWMVEYSSFVRGLPSRSASVSALCADRTRNAYLAEVYHLQAQVAGTTTPAGAKLAGMAHGCDMHCARFSLAARDVALREAGLDREDAPGGGLSLSELLEAKNAVAANLVPEAREELLDRLERLATAAGYVPPEQPVADAPAPVRVATEIVGEVLAPPRLLPPAPLDRDSRIDHQRRFGPRAWADAIDADVAERERKGHLP